MPINFVKNGKPNLIIWRICGRINLPEVAKKNNIVNIIIKKIIFLYLSDFFNETFFLFLRI